MRLRGVSDVAEELDVSPRRVRQLLASGQLRGQQVGRSWVIEPHEVEQLRRRGVGRPWSAASAWAVLNVADGQGRDLSPAERSRARQRLRQHGLDGLVGPLRSRAEARSFYGHPSALDRLVDDPGVVRGGVSAARDHDADLIAGEPIELYVRRSRLAELVDRYALDSDADRPNVLVRIVDDDAWPFGDDAGVAPWPVVAVDLLDAGDDRSRRAGLELIGRHA